jgi:hypothetical protein
MRHGWKTRIDERIYFENKRYEREERQQFLNLMRMEIESKMSMFSAELAQRERFHNETH